MSVPLGLVPAVGTEVPKTIQVYWMPPSLGLNRYRYAVVNERTLVVDYVDRRVVAILD